MRQQPALARTHSPRKSGRRVKVVCRVPSSWGHTVEAGNESSPSAYCVLRGVFLLSAFHFRKDFAFTGMRGHRQRHLKGRLTPSASNLSQQKRWPRRKGRRCVSASLGFGRGGGDRSCPTSHFSEGVSVALLKNSFEIESAYCEAWQCGVAVTDPAPAPCRGSVRVPQASPSALGREWEEPSPPESLVASRPLGTTPPRDKPLTVGQDKSL